MDEKKNEKKKRDKKTVLPGVPFDPVDNDYPKNKQLILPGSFQNTFGSFGMTGFNLLNDPSSGKNDDSDPEKSDRYLYL